VEAGGARLVADEDLDGARLRQAADLFGAPDLAVMAAAARSLGRPAAAAVTADLLIALADGTALPEADALEQRTRTVP